MGEGLQISNIPSWVTIGYLVAVGVLALWKGGPHERLIAATQSLLLLNGFGPWEPGLPWLPLDFAQFLACLACALRSRSYWTIWASAATLLSVIVDVVYLTTPEIGLWAYLSAGLVWAYTLNTALLLGTLARVRRVLKATGGAPAPWPQGAISRASR